MELFLSLTDWEKLRKKIKSREIKFIIEPTTRFNGSAGQQSTMFIKDPSGNALGFKSFVDDTMIFEK